MFEVPKMISKVLQPVQGPWLAMLGIIEPHRTQKKTVKHDTKTSTSLNFQNPIGAPLKPY